MCRQSDLNSGPLDFKTPNATTELHTLHAQSMSQSNILLEGSEKQQKCLQLLNA